MELGELEEICKDVYKREKLHPDHTVGKCAKVTASLHLELLKNKIPSKLYVVNDCHCFLTVDCDGIEYVLDLTYSQFNPWICTPLIEPLEQYKNRKNNFDIWGRRTKGNKIRCTYSLKHFKKYLLRRWPFSQKPLLKENYA